jgi:hypothetical protein
MTRRLIIVGGPHVGKTTLAKRLKDELGIANTKHSDDVKHLGWSESSEAASRWFNESGEWIIEGVQTARALRKWLKANPKTPLAADLVILDKPFDTLVQGQESMRKGVHTVFSEIESELINRGTRIHRLNHPNEAIDLFQDSYMPEDNTDAKSDKTSEEEGKNTDDSAKGKDTDTSKSQDADKKFTQADLDRIAAKTREEEKTKAKAAKDKEEKERLEAEATKQGEFQKLADDRKVKLDELEPKVAALEAERIALTATLAEIAEAGLKELPKEVSDIAPVQRAEGKSLINPLDVLAWLPKGKTLADKLNGQSAAKGAKPSPRANGGHGADTDADKRAKAIARQAYRE